MADAVILHVDPDDEGFDRLPNPSESDISTASSGIPGIGYFSGKAVKWVGEQMLDAFILLEIPRRRRIINDLVSQLKNIHVQDRSKWIFERKRKINRAIEDLLELTTWVLQFAYFQNVTPICL